MKLVGTILAAAAALAAAAPEAEEKPEFDLKSAVENIRESYDGAIDRYLEEEHAWEPEIVLLDMPEDVAEEAAGLDADIKLWYDRAAPAFKDLPADAVFNVAEGAWEVPGAEEGAAPRQLQTYGVPSCHLNQDSSYSGSYGNLTFQRQRINVFQKDYHTNGQDFDTTQISTLTYTWLAEMSTVCSRGSRHSFYSTKTLDDVTSRYLTTFTSRGQIPEGGQTDEAASVAPMVNPRSEERTSNWRWQPAGNRQNGGTPMYPTYPGTPMYPTYPSAPSSCSGPELPNLRVVPAGSPRNPGPDPMFVSSNCPPEADCNNAEFEAEGRGWWAVSPEGRGPIEECGEELPWCWVKYSELLMMPFRRLQGPDFGGMPELEGCVDACEMMLPGMDHECVAECTEQTAPGVRCWRYCNEMEDPSSGCLPDFSNAPMYPVYPM